MDRNEIYSNLHRQLVEEGALWSYTDGISDEVLIEKVLVYLDLPQIDDLFRLFRYSKIKAVWRERLVPRDDYYHTLNRFLAWYYFRSTKPDSYLKSLLTRHYNKLAA